MGFLQTAISSETTPHQPVNHVFVDLENVKSIDVAVTGGRNLKIQLFFGPRNKKLDVDVVEKLLENAQAVSLRRENGNLHRKTLSDGGLLASDWLANIDRDSSLSLA